MADAAGQDARVDAPLIDAPSVDAPRIDASIDAPMSDAEADAAATCLGTAESCGQNPTACVNCAGNAAGHTCIGNTMCGCNVETDCPTFVACDTSTHACTNACSATQPCNGGCCSMSACHTGDQMGACGNTGVECLQCGTQATGHMCVPTSNGGFCGCSSNNDCPGGGTCNTTTHLCI
ncbi:MAG TPA: hypothetical protein VKN99_26325 [Polyangia bacterium]|nr:hypothetical protein [Polyangia bacterium]